MRRSGVPQRRAVGMVGHHEDIGVRTGVALALVAGVRGGRPRVVGGQQAPQRRPADAQVHGQLGRQAPAQQPPAGEQHHPVRPEGHRLVAVGAVSHRVAQPGQHQAAALGFHRGEDLAAQRGLVEPAVEEHVRVGTAELQADRGRAQEVVGVHRQGGAAAGAQPLRHRPGQLQRGRWRGAVDEHAHPAGQLRGALGQVRRESRPVDGPERPCHVVLPVLACPRSRSDTRRMVGDGAGAVLRRALRVLEAVAEAGDGVSAKALARRLELPLPTTYRLLGTLVEEGYLVRLHAERGYGLGYRVVGLYRGMTDPIVPPAPAREVLAELHTTARAAVVLAVLRSDDVVVAHTETCAAHPGPGAVTGEPLPAHATAPGKALLAGLDGGRLADVLGLGHGPLTPHTLTDRRLLDRDLLRVRSAGVAVEVEEHARGRAGLAVAVPHPGGRAALSVVVSRADFTGRRWELERAVREAAVPLARHLSAAPGVAASG
ncbi:Transcriptional regulator, IclR family [Pseudonocardia sp. Ae505_Ps2]|nr:Transcriptional regulator, IclR family [Pseudonocardia sp. Ae505_Ps2]